MIEKHLENQTLAVNLLQNQINNNKTLQAYLFCHSNISYLKDFAKDFSKNLILGEKEDKNIIKKIDEDIYDELMIISPEKGVIKKEQIIALKKFISTKPVEGLKKIYIIESCENLNITSANSMLKFVEEPEEDVIAIFLTNNLDLVIPTIKSRCQVVVLSEKAEKDEFGFLNIDFKVLENYEEILKNTIDFLTVVEEDKINSYYKINKNLIKFFSEKEVCEIFLNLLMYIYYESFNYKTLEHFKWIKDENLKNIIIKIAYQDTNIILRKIEILEKINIDFKFNLNYKLLIDRIILELCEV